MLRRVEGERVPARVEHRVGGYGVAGEEDPSFGPPEGEVTGRVARGMEHANGADRIPVFQRGVHGAGRVFTTPQRRAELQVVDAPVGAKGTHRNRRDRLGGPLTRDDVSLPRVRVDGCATQPLQGGQSAEMGTVGVRQHDVFQSLHAPADALYTVDYPFGVRVEERVDQR